MNDAPNPANSRIAGGVSCPTAVWVAFAGLLNPAIWRLASRQPLFLFVEFAVGIVSACIISAPSIMAPR
jgi:hypothetical protein